MRAITEQIRNVSRVRKISLEDVIRVSFDAMDKVTISGVEQVVIATVIAKFHYTDPTGPGSPTKSTHVVGYNVRGSV